MDGRTVGGAVMVAVAALLLVPSQKAPGVENDPAVRALIEHELLIATNTQVYNPMAPLGGRPKPRRIEIRSVVARRSVLDALIGLERYGAKVEFAEEGNARCGTLNLDRSTEKGKWIVRKARARPCDSWF